ncbi:rhomboid family intramembrane serine protease [Paenibacillus sp. Marseille-P2973]|uniref:rhomboid family intramembrane serine protease n=1 Tax=Paenibacillus sp. Marseille-P2973 TaxID=1871032 RepID=UPI001B3810EE|nr:rhomboid family intramembrane serine protease [Paenibacillus sp. Marseille-P2973]MBQ4898644.1 rhomboid family intramembrane serine protease [Paenibacillus sp. Marseille-P2973]
MIFIRYENWKSYLRYYPVTVLILVANLVMFLLVMFNGGSDNPYTQLKYGALTNVEPYASEYWRLLGSMFLHHDFGHLFSNSFAILVFAPPLERLLGHWRYALLYIGSGLVGNLISLEVYQRSMDIHLSVGASGAVYGVYGAFLYIALLQRQLMDESSRKTLYSLLIIGVVFSVIVPQVNWMAHFGGLIGGFFLYGIIIRVLKRR